jgi:hypothetical protein
LTAFTSSGLVNSQTIGSVTETSAGTAVTAGVSGSPYTITPSAATGGTFSANNYNITYTNGSLTVNPLAVSVATVNGATRAYNGTANAGSSLLTVSNAINGDTVTLSGNGVLAGSGAGTEALSSLTGLSLNNANYTLTAGSTSGSVAIAQAPLTVTASNASKTYGQTPTLTAFTSNGLVNSETIGSVTETSAGSAVTAGVAGSPYSITPSAATGGTFSANNYNITYTNGSLTVNPLAVSVATVANASKIYDGTTNAAANLLTVSNAINGDAVTLSGNATLAGSGVGSEALSSVSNLTVNNPNYTVIGGTTSGLVVVTPQESVMANAIIQVQPTNNAQPPSSTPVAVVTQTGQPASGGQVSSFVNVVTPLPQLSVTFGGGSQLTIISSPSANEPTQVVSLSQARGMMQSVINSGGSPGDGSGVPQGGGDIVGDVRVPVSRNSLAEIVNGGVRLPTGLEQELFVVKAQ